MKECVWSVGAAAHSCWTPHFPWHTFTCVCRFLKRAVEAAANIVMPTEGGVSGAGCRCTQFELDSLNLHAMSKIVQSWQGVLL
jgi:hypothetical protein